MRVTTGPTDPKAPANDPALPTRLQAVVTDLMVVMHRTDNDPAGVIAEVTSLVDRFLDPASGPFPPGYETRVRLYASTAIINAAMMTGDVRALELGVQWTSAAVEDPGLDNREALSAGYNRANAYSATVAIHIRHCHAAQPGPGWPAAYREARWVDRELLAATRAGFRRYATEFPDSEQQSVGWCNLANEFNLSGRWLEAYDAYVAALAADPTNGNAAGNAATMIRQIADAGWGYGDLLHGLHDHYLAQAHALRDRTVQIAGEHAALLYDAMKPYGCHSQTRHQARPEDPYQMWVARHRLALAPALEGIGANEHHWDTAMIASAASRLDTAESPAIFRMLNLIKGEYLAARRLAYRAGQMLDEAPYGQHPDDPGRYIDTLDYALYGEATATLLLAQRSALDTLDKIAVAVNDHLGTGDNPGKINFRGFWTTKNGDQIRPELLAHDDTLAFLALAELALDLGRDGLYVQAQELRNAATHRFPLVHLGWKEITPTGALVPVAVGQATAATRHALSVARSAYLYVVAMLDTIESASTTAPPFRITLPDQKEDEPDSVNDWAPGLGRNRLEPNIS